MRRSRKGSVFLLTVIGLMLLSTLALNMSYSSAMEFRKALNHRDALAARLAAESGKEFFLLHLNGYSSEAKTTAEEVHIYDELYNHLSSSVSAATVSISDNTGGGKLIEVGSIDLESGGDPSFTMELFPTEFDEGDTSSPTKFQMSVTGQSSGASHTLAVSFNVAQTKNLLYYASVSSLRVIARGKIRIHGPVASSWGRNLKPGVRNNSTYPLNIHLKTGGFINGSLGTTLSRSDFIGYPSMGDTDFHNGIKHDDSSVNLLSQMEYDEPPVMELDVDDFDTTPLRDMTTSEISNPDETNYKLGVWGLRGDKWENKTFENIRVPKGTNPYFENCEFNGITYIEVDETDATPTKHNHNTVVFKDCTFNGPIVTGVPRIMDWRYNCMQFQGNTVFNTSMLETVGETLSGGVTVMAPNYNINIGGSEGGGGGTPGDSDCVGMIIGGCVDIYNKFSLQGTVISMAKITKHGKLNVSPGGNDNWLKGNVCGANIGNLDGSSDDIDIWPDTENTLPLGVKHRFQLIIIPLSYVEGL